MKILIITEDFSNNPSDLSSRKIYDLAIGRAKNSDEVHVLLTNPNALEQEIPNVQLHQIQEPLPVKHYEGTGNIVIANLALLEKVMQLQDRVGKFDEIISSGWTFSHAAKSIKAITGAKWYLVMHNSPRADISNPQSLYIDELSAWARSKCDKVFC